MSAASTSPEKTAATGRTAAATACSGGGGAGRGGGGGGGCPHLASQHKAAMERLKVLVAYAHVCRHRQALLQGRRGGASLAVGGEGDRSRKRLVDEMPGPGCAACGTAGDRLHACLQCDAYACWRGGCGGGGGGGGARRVRSASHLAQHQRATGHVLALDFARLHVFCAACGDYVHDAGVAALVTAARTRWHAALCDAAEPEAKRPRIVAATGELSAAAARYAREHGSHAGGGGGGGAAAACAAVRGVLNLGATCYLSAVVQALAHNPVVRGWMLSDSHRSRACAHSSGAGGGGGCMACELDAAVQALHGGGGDQISGNQIASNSSFAPVRLLRTLWASAGNVAGAGQQDAHECLVAVLGALHAAHASASSSSNEEDASPNGGCACVAHTAFAGVLQSAVTCARCGNTTRALDPMLDISLDIPPAPAARAADAALNAAMDARRGGGGGCGPAGASLTRGQRPVLTLHDCLAHYTRAEALAPGAYRCARCAAPAAAVKQLSVRELPPVLTFQLKRFAASAGAASAKVDAFVRLPLHVDMTPYTAAALATPQAQPVPVAPEPIGGGGGRVRRADATRANPACQYSLFAVIDHAGLLDTGHYTAYARHRARWFRFDDAAVTRADVRDVLGFADDAAARQGRPAKGRAYMAFYVKTVLDYHDASATATATASVPPPQPASASGGLPDDWVEDAGVVRPAAASATAPPPPLPGAEAKVERRGRKKGSTNAARNKAKPKDADAAEPLPPLPPPPPPPPLLPPLPPPPPASQPQPQPHSADPSEEDSDGEALWARISKEKPVDDLVPMLPLDASSSSSLSSSSIAPPPPPPPLFIDPAALVAPTNTAYDDEDDDDDGEEEEEEDDNDEEEEHAFSDSD